MLINIPTLRAITATTILSLISTISSHHQAFALATPGPTESPEVQLDEATFVGTFNSTTNTNKFLGIPYAQPPIGDLRFRLPLPNDPYTGAYNSTSFSPSCPQQTFQLTLPINLDPIAKAVVNATTSQLVDSSEDCLTVNVWQPAGVREGDGLPVVIWIFGGGFENGGSSPYDGSIIVHRSMEMNQPVIYVSLNHRVSAFGFLGGEEVKAAGVANIGLHDQRQAFRWVQKYISAFGGDPSKVTIWGQSSGAISVSLHMLANGGDNEGLFRAGFMQSGSPHPYGEIENGQWSYDWLVDEVGCGGAGNTLQCLREAPYEAIKQAIDESPSVVSRMALNSSWVPRADGVFLRDPPQHAVLKGDVADIPFVTGNCDDEGTLFSLAQTDITTNNDTKAFITSNYLSLATPSEVDQLLSVYPDDITQGSPFDTGDANALTPEYKRLAALQGDLVFIATRRFLLQQRSGKQPTWSFLSKRSKSTPDLGSYHGHDLANIYGPGELTDYLINFVNTLDPNGNGSQAGITNWPQYTPSSPALMTFLDGDTPQTITQDTYREDAIRNITELFLKYPL